MFKIPKGKKHKPTTNKSQKQQKYMPSVALPYIRGLPEQFNNIFRTHCVRTYHKPFNSIRSMVVNPKHKIPDLKKCGVVYKISCADCHVKYKGETRRNLGTRLKEHTNLKACTLSAVGEHSANHQHVFDQDNVRVIAREDNFWRRQSKYARKNHP